MFLVDTEEGRIVDDNEIKGKIARQKPYRRWLEENRIELRGLFQPSQADAESIPKTLAQRLRAFGYTREDLQMIVGPMAANGQEPVGSMGTDTPLAVLSDQPKLLFNYFKQLFAQVTNPPIDPLREGLVMSLMSFTGKQRNLLDETPEHCRQLKLPHPILTNDDMERLRTVQARRFQGGHAAGVVRLPRRTIRRRALAAALDELVDAAEQAIADGASLLIVSDRDVSPRARRRFPACWPRRPCTTACWQRRLRSAGGHRRRKRRAARGDALLPAVAATAPTPSIRTWPSRPSTSCTPTAICPTDVAVDQLIDHYITAVKKGILKTMSKMGISTLRSYHVGPAVRGRRPEPRRDRQVLHRHRLADRGHRPGRDRPRGLRAAPQRASAAATPARWISTSAASTSTASTASSISGTRTPSPRCSTR